MPKIKKPSRINFKPAPILSSNYYSLSPSPFMVRSRMYNKAKKHKAVTINGMIHIVYLQSEMDYHDIQTSRTTRKVALRKNDLPRITL